MKTPVLALAVFGLLLSSTHKADCQTRNAPVRFQSYLKPSKPGRNARFGNSIAMIGDTLAIGAPGEESVFVFVNRSGGWRQEAVLQASNMQEGDLFGMSLSMSNDLIVVGAPRESSGDRVSNTSGTDNSAPEAGAVYVFTRLGERWTQQAYLKSPTANSGDRFGEAVALSRTFLCVGTPGDDSSLRGVWKQPLHSSSGTDAGAVHIFSVNGQEWDYESYIKASNADTGDNFGCSVSVFDDSLVVGALYESSNSKGVSGNESDNSLMRSGATYVFVREGGGWRQEAYLKASNPDREDQFGASVSLFQNTLVVGAPYEDGRSTGANGNESTNGLIDSGAAYVFERLNGAWTQVAYLKSSNSDESDGFGRSVAATGQALIVAATWEGSQSGGINGDQTDNGDTASGAAYLFRRSGRRWIQSAYIKAPDPVASDQFGTGVAIDSNTITVAAPFEDKGEFNSSVSSGNRILNSGAAYTYRYQSSSNYLSIIKYPRQFAPTYLNQTSQNQSLLVRNEGANLIRNIRLRVLGGARRDFSLSRGSIVSLHPGENGQVEVSFKPQRPGTRMATLLISGDFQNRRLLLRGKGLLLRPRLPVF